MNFYQVYFIMAAATAIHSMFELFIPVINGLNKDSTLYRYRILTYISCFVLTIVLAPFILSSLFSPNHGNRFRNALTDAFKA